ncbi:MAG: hypothetical protein NVSMB57_16080 [Actinomycetota bacterium]
MSNSPKEFIFRLRLPAHPLSVSAARRVLGALEGWINEETLSRAELVTSEIVTNAIRHGSRFPTDEVEVVFEAQMTSLAIRVRDSGSPFPLEVRTPQPGDIGGFGLQITHRLAKSVTVSRLADSGGNEVVVTLNADLHKLFEP